MSNIDWSQLVTRAAKNEAQAVMILRAAKVAFTEHNTQAVGQIVRVQDRIDTLTYGIEVGEATVEDQAELFTLSASLKEWKTYKFALGNVPRQANWPASPEWPQEPAIPDIAAALMPDADVPL